MAYLGVPIIQDVCMHLRYVGDQVFFFCLVKYLVFGTMLLSNMMARFGKPMMLFLGS